MLLIGNRTWAASAYVLARRPAAPLRRVPGTVVISAHVGPCAVSVRGTGTFRGETEATATVGTATAGV